MKNRYWLFVGAAATLTLGGCHWDMWVQSKDKSQDFNPYWNAISSNPSSTRPPVNGTMAFKSDYKDTAYYTGFVNGQVVKEFPIPVTHDLIERGKDRFTIFCSHCHGQAGDGKGMINQRGFSMARPVATYHTNRLRAMPIGHFFDVMTTGFGAMYPFAARISPHDRWAIASYIRVLQLSQQPEIGDLDAQARKLFVNDDFSTTPQKTGTMFVSPDVAPTTWPPKAPPAPPAKPAGAQGGQAPPVGGDGGQAPPAGDDAGGASPQRTAGGR